MPSKETDLADREHRQRTLDEALADARLGRDQLRNLADQPPPERDGPLSDVPNRGLRR